ncbi:MAG: RNA polymerase sigma factor [Actinobacteria bacterium]|nr:MAG: RNA polymerase sigma factor [Actinomycetota bacterium]
MVRIPESKERERPDLGTLYAEEGQRLWRAVFAFCHDREIASDAVAESFAQAVRRGADIRDPRAWVWRVAFRVAAGQLKERGKESHEVPEVTYEMPEEPGRLLDALRRLPPRQRAALVLRHYAGYPTEEIAQILGSSRATVRVHLSRGRKRLYELLGDDDA